MSIVDSARGAFLFPVGNSCRSPMAEAIFQDEIKKLGLTDAWEVDSAALLAYHVGKAPEPRAIATLRKAGIIGYTHKARQIVIDDFYEFDWIFGMDHDNIRELWEMRPSDSCAKIELLGKYDPDGELVIRDPYFDENIRGFEKAFGQAARSVKVFFEMHKSTA